MLQSRRPAAFSRSEKTSDGRSPGRYTVRFNAAAGKRYAFEVSPRDEQLGVALVGVIADSAINSENSGAFKIVAVASGT